jgi:hypothetical protein
MQADNIFKTKTGFCYVLPDKIVLTREGVAGEAAKRFVGSSIARPLIIYGLLSIFNLYNAWTSFIEKKYGFTSFFASLGIWFIYSIFSNLNNSATPEISRDTIQKIVFKPAKPGLTRAYFEVIFIENGESKKRLILLPGSFTNGSTEATKALEVFKSQGLSLH